MNMLRNIFLKTVYEKRWSLVIWSICLIALVLLTVVFYPTLRDSFGESLKDVPESMQALLGDATSYQTLAGYVDLQVFSQLVFMTIIMGVILGSSMIAGDEGEGTLQTLLAYPISRGKVYTQKFLGLSVLMAAASLAVGAGIFLGALVVRESLPIVDTFVACAMLWLITMVFTGLAYSLGAITGKRGLSGAGVGGLAFTTYLVTTLASNVDALRYANYISPFRYFNNPSVYKAGFQLDDTLILLVIAVVTFAAGYLVFVKRDIYQQ